MCRALQSWNWRLLLMGGLLFALMGGECGEGDCESFSDLGEWFRCVWSDIENWF